MDHPPISVVIPSFNQGSFIERTLLSVLKQEYGGKIEVIVSDGGSSDNTIDILKKYDSRIIWWSEKDAGYADAVNKGFRSATGEIYAIQSTDDYYLKDAFVKMVNCLNAHKDAILACGREALQESDGHIFGGYELPEKITPRSFLLDHQFPGIFQHTTFFKREIFEIVGGMRQEFDMCADADLFYRMLHFGNGCFLDDYIAVYQRHHKQRTQTQTLIFENQIIDMVNSCKKDPFYNLQFSISDEDQYLFNQFISLFYLTYKDKEVALKEARSILGDTKTNKRTSELAKNIINQSGRSAVKPNPLKIIRIAKRIFNKYILQKKVSQTQTIEIFSEKLNANWWKIQDSSI